ncbi:gustatory receptor for sugar taste 61a-like [Pecten maximus]|uniref:gustatory receptor for sugar taste 61a-like n=1 Tax=Pecten maximus TaxID=6579 RepID=UPI001458E5F3|nr:gustatory receptor for sugar taste 61a-like [Pecten maximus]
MLRACWSRDHLQIFFRNLNKIVADTTTSSNTVDEKYDEWRKIVRFRTVVAWILTFVSFSSLIVQSVTEYNDDFDTGIANPFPHRNKAVTYFFLCLQIWEVGAWLFPILFQVTLFTFLSHQFSSLDKDIIRMIEENGEMISQKVKDIRRKHLQLCKAVSILEQDTQYFMAATYVSNIFLVCFIVYQMVTSGTLSIFTYVSFSSWLMMNTMITLTVSVTAAQVNEQAHSLLENIYDVDMSKASTFESLEMQMFLSKLNGPAIGFTAMGFVTVTKEFILTLGGIIITYFFLLLQFQL